MKEKDIYNQFDFNTLNVTQKAVLDAYLKRFASLQDFLGAKVFSLLLEHDYLEELEEALKDLKFCIDSFEKIELHYNNSLNFAK